MPKEDTMTSSRGRGRGSGSETPLSPEQLRTHYERGEPLVELRLVYADGTQDSRFWGIDDKPPMGGFDQPDWMNEPRKSWKHPQDPICFSALVEVGREDEARSWLDEQGGTA
jgi:hypothetical protein